MGLGRPLTHWARGARLQAFVRRVALRLQVFDLCRDPLRVRIRLQGSHLGFQLAQLRSQLGDLGVKNSVK